LNFSDIYCNYFITKQNYKEIVNFKKFDIYIENDVFLIELTLMHFNVDNYSTFVNTKLTSTQALQIIFEAIN